MPAERLTGVRTDYSAASDAIHAWAERVLGAPVVETRPRIGGMSPAVAVSLRAENGRTAFVKAVSGEINPDTPSHLRHEIGVLTTLPAAPYRAGLLSTYDDGDWVGLALEDVEGRHPDWDSLRDRVAVLNTVRQQTKELTPVPRGMPAATSREAIAKHLETMANPTPSELAALPDWAIAGLPTLVDLCQNSLNHQDEESFCHWDIRHDNILIRSTDEQPVLLDWGMSRRGCRWADTVVFALEWVDSEEFDQIVETIDPSAEEALDITGFVAGIGCYLTMCATHPPPPGLPNMPAFRRQVGSACLEGVRRGLGS